jgi:hypothetical protein
MFLSVGIAQRRRGTRPYLSGFLDAKLGNGSWMVVKRRATSVAAAAAPELGEIQNG